MKRLFCIILIFSFISSVSAQTKNNAGAPPKLIVLITIDQFRGDLLERYDKAFTGGFRRLLDRGFRYTRATVDHAPTNSYPGHVTIATGAFPKRHGIIDNSWVEIVEGSPAMTGGAADATEKIVGFPNMPGVSPNKLLVTGLADWVLAQDKNAVVVSLSSNEYGSLLHSGKSRGHTYWFSPEAGQFVTSTYYQKNDPAWIEKFNRDAMPKFINQKTWNNTVPEKFQKLAFPDATKFEFDNIHNTFPHIFEKEVSKEEAKSAGALADWFYFSPFMDEAALSLTKIAVSELKLGQRDSTDYLSLTLGATDSIGHRFGPLSLEQLDNLMRLDRGLDKLFKFLDKQIGADKYIVAVTGDHGASDIPEHQIEKGQKAFRVTEKDMDSLLEEVNKYAVTVRDKPENVRSEIARMAEKYEFIADAITRDELAAKENKNEFLELYRNSFYPGRSPIYPVVSQKFPSFVSYGIRVRLAENAVPFFAPSNHGTPNFYDRHVALIFMGKGIKDGTSQASARTVDVAPTLAARGKINIPVEIDGRELSLLKK
jgi:predicted AlkP superfamily pyrophosphatase or phosphodiesterase